MIQFKEYYYDIKLVLVAVTITAIVVVPISVAVILPRTEVILSNSVVTLSIPHSLACRRDVCTLEMRRR